MRKKAIAIILTAVLCAGTLSGCRIGDTNYTFHKKKETVSHDVFSINGAKCSPQEARLYFCNYRNLYGTAYGINLWEEISNKEELEAYVKTITLTELIRIYCMDLLAENLELALDENEEKLVASAAEEYYKSLSGDEIKYMEISQKNIEDYYRHYVLAQKLYSSLTQGVNEEVSDDEARVIRVMQIYVTKKETADTIVEKLGKNEDFATIAGRYNEAEAIEVTVSRGQFPKEVEKAAFALENGAISEMVEADGAYYFVKCLSKFEEELTEANKENIREQREKEQFDDVYNEFVKETVGEMNEEIWASIVLDDSISITTDSFFLVYEKYFKDLYAKE